jgi:hypothetical protein
VQEGLRCEPRAGAGIEAAGRRFRERERLAVAPRPARPPAPPAELNGRQRRLQTRLIAALLEAIPVEAELDRAQGRARSCYRSIAVLLVELRHECRGPGGEPHDLRGRSFHYRLAVRAAYARAGAHAGAPVPKRLTAGVAYWVRKLLIERYGQRRLYEVGVLRGPLPAPYEPWTRPVDQLPEDPAECLKVVVGILNSLAVDPALVPTEEAVRSATRAVLLLRQKLMKGPKPLPEPAADQPRSPVIAVA